MGDQLVVLGVVVLDVHLKQLLVAEQLVAVLEGAANTLGQMERSCYKKCGNNNNVLLHIPAPFPRDCP